MAEEQKSSNDGGDQWVAAILIEAQTRNPSIPDAVRTRLEGVLKGQMSERDMTSTSLKKLATQLIGDMVPTQQQTEDTQ